MNKYYDNLRSERDIVLQAKKSMTPLEVHDILVKEHREAMEKELKEVPFMKEPNYEVIVFRKEKGSSYERTFNAFINDYAADHGITRKDIEDAIVSGNPIVLEDGASVSFDEVA